MPILKTTPVLQDYLWGGNKLTRLFGRVASGACVAESWEVSVHPAGESVVNGKKLSDAIAETQNFVDRNNHPFPVLIKYIDAAQNLSVQVHPNDEFAQQYENDNGKTEMWYIISADPDAGIYCGLRQAVTPALFAEAAQNGTVEKFLNFIPVRAGDCFLIRAGTVHAIGAGCVICEIQQNSNVTYRVYDYNRRGADGKPRELHLEKALRVIDFEKFVDRTGSTPFERVEGGRMRLLTRCRYFTCRELDLAGEFRNVNENSFTALNVISGSGTACGLSFVAGDSFILPCGEQLVLEGEAKVILTGRPEEV